MNQRERSMLLVAGTIGGFLLLFGGFIFAQSTLEGLEQKDHQIDNLRSDVTTAETELLLLAKKQSKLRHWQTIGLPADRKLAGDRYLTFLRDLCERHFPNRENDPKKWQVGGQAASAGATRNAGAATAIPFSLTLTGVSLHQLLDFLLEFHAADVLHQVRHMAITPDSGGPEPRLNASLKIEAMVLPTATDRDTVPVVVETQRFVAELVAALAPTVPLSFRGVVRLSPLAAHSSHKLAAAFEPQRDYAALATKNLFIGLKAPSSISADRDVLKFTQLTGIQADFINTEAWIRNRPTNEFTKLRAEVPFDTFKIHDRMGQVVLSGKVVAIQDRQIEAVLEMGGESRRCIIHIGQFLDQVWRDGKKMSEAEAKATNQDAKESDTDKDP